LIIFKLKNFQGKWPQFRKSFSEWEKINQKNHHN
jgi:hypothetical protein